MPDAKDADAKQSNGYRNDDVSDSAQRSGDNFDKDIYNVPWRDQNEHVASDFNYMTVVCK